jgi:hypothetical protein
VISVVVLQNSMDLPRGGLGLSSKAYVTSTVSGNQTTCKEGESVSVMTEGVKDKPTAISIIKTEPNVSCACGQCNARFGSPILLKKMFDPRLCILSSF